MPPLKLSGIFSFLPTAPTTSGIYPLSLHDALPILTARILRAMAWRMAVLALVICVLAALLSRGPSHPDRKSTRLNSSHMSISYAVFCLKKKNTVGDDRVESGRGLIVEHA